MAKTDLLSPENCAIALIDYQPAMYQGVQSHDRLETLNNHSRKSPTKQRFENVDTDELPITLGFFFDALSARIGFSVHAYGALLKLVMHPTTAVNLDNQDNCTGDEDRDCKMKQKLTKNRPLFNSMKCE